MIIDWEVVSQTPKDWLDRYCLSLDGQFVFIDPVSWQIHCLSEGAVTVLRSAAESIECGDFEAFVGDVEAAGGWPPGLEFLVRSLTTLPLSDLS